MKGITKTDLLILSYLREDARIKLTDLSRKTGIPISTIYEKLKNFRANGLIRLIGLVDYGRLGFSTRVLIAFKVDRDIREEVEQYLIANRNVNSVQRINNGFTFMVFGIYRDMREAEDFIIDLEEQYGIQKKMVFYVIEEVKREGFNESDIGRIND